MKASCIALPNVYSSSSHVTNLSWCGNGEKVERSGQVSLVCTEYNKMCGSLFPKSSFRCKLDGCGKAPFRAAECVYERFWSGMGTRNDEPGPGDHPASVTHTTPHRANKEQGERERQKSNNNALSVRVLIFFLAKFLSTPLSFLHPPLLKFWAFCT